MAPEVEKSPVATGHGGADESADEALRAFAGMDPGVRDVLVVDAATNRRLLRRIDLYIMPVSTLKYHSFALSSAPSKKEKKRKKNESLCGRDTDDWDRWD